NSNPDQHFKSITNSNQENPAKRHKQASTELSAKDNVNIGNLQSSNLNQSDDDGNESLSVIIKNDGNNNLETQKEKTTQKRIPLLRSQRKKSSVASGQKKRQKISYNIPPKYKNHLTKDLKMSFLSLDFTNLMLIL
ncbi:hypothetical protein HK096_000373, partial [Nowakowskiella sp. JEL0078]